MNPLDARTWKTAAEMEATLGALFEEVTAPGYAPSKERDREFKETMRAVNAAIREARRELKAQIAAATAKESA